MKNVCTLMVRSSARSSSFTSRRLRKILPGVVSELASLKLWGDLYASNELYGSDCFSLMDASVAIRYRTLLSLFFSLGALPRSSTKFTPDMCCLFH